MASSAVHRLVFRNQSESASKLFTYFRKPLLPIQNSVFTHIPNITKFDDVSPFRDRPEKDFLKPGYSCSENIYPGFSLRFFLNPACPTSVIRSEPDAETIMDDSHIIKADSVKKKRKKKMNKHKLSKLRKRLGKRT